jgi:hypothetical protein
MMDLPINLFFILQGKINLLGSGGNSTKPNIFQQSQNSNFEKNNNYQYQKFEQTNSNKTAQNQMEQPNQNLPNINKQQSFSNTNQNQQQYTPTPMYVEPQPKVDELKNEIFVILDSLMKEVVDIRICKDVLKGLHTILINIINNPGDEKYRKIKLESNFFKKNIQPYHFAMKFLQFCFFANNNEFLEFMGDLDYLIKVCEKINDFLIEKSK